MKLGLPAVAVTTDQFENLARTIMKSRNVPDSIMILIKGNPEFISDDELNKVADHVLEEAVRKLTGSN